MVSIIFNVIIFKRKKENINTLIHIISLLLKQNNATCIEIISNKTQIILDYLKKGKQIEKAILSLKSFFKASPYLLKQHLQPFLEIIKNTNNKFLFEAGLDFINHKLHFGNIRDQEILLFVRGNLLDSVEEFVTKSNALKISAKKRKLFGKNMVGYFKDDEALLSKVRLVIGN